MDIRLNAADRDAAGRRPATSPRRCLIPLEDECEEHDGLSPESHAAAKRAVLDWRFNAINHPVADGGQGYDLFQQMLIEEQWGHATGALWDLPWRPSIPLQRGTEAQKERYLRPAIRGERRDAYAITEEGAGSDPSMVATARPPRRRRLGARRREVARDGGRRRRLLRAARARRRRPREGDRVPRGQGRAGRAARAHARSTCTRSCSSTRSSRSRACAWATTRSSARSARGSSSRRTGSSRSA